MLSRTFGALAAAALALPVATQAADFDYSFVDLALLPHVQVEAGNDDIDGDGFQLRGSLAVSSNFFVLAQLQDFDLDHGVDVTRWMVGGGGHWPLNNTVDLVASVGVVRLNVDVGRFDDHDTGVFLGGRVRAQVAPRFELEGGVEYISAEVGDAGDDVYLVGEGRYHFNDQFSVGALLNFSSDVETLGVYGRYSF
ncbi:MAG TPA: hypothetical protein VNR40_04120 [Steroidobacter sp.]|nr:hypothetical protein [Steroidobacter sp.]HWK73126.1 hypothetical protein [Povalibacter sp.]